MKPIRTGDIIYVDQEGFPKISNTYIGSYANQVCFHLQDRAIVQAIQCDGTGVWVGSLSSRSKPMRFYACETEMRGKGI